MSLAVLEEVPCSVVVLVWLFSSLVGVCVSSCAKIIGQGNPSSPAFSHTPSCPTTVPHAPTNPTYSKHRRSKLRQISY